MRRRQAFTLVEMMVAMALVIFVMLLLSQAFVAGIDTFRQLKAIGDMEERSRSVVAMLKRDLGANHFDGNRRLSDSGFWTQGPPREGFFRIWQGSVPVAEGFDGDNLPSYRVTDTWLHFTTRLRGNNRQDFFSTSISATCPLSSYGAPVDSRYQDSGTYTCQWAEIAYFLQPSGDFAGGTPLYTLYRRQLLLVPDNNYLNWGSPIPAVPLTPPPARDHGHLGDQLRLYRRELQTESVDSRQCLFQQPHGYDGAPTALWDATRS